MARKKKIEVKYFAYKTKYTLGKLYIGGEYICDVLTRRARWKFGEVYVKGSSATPPGTYTCQALNSPRFSGQEFYKQYLNGNLVRVLGFSGSSNILFHVGNTAADTEGCFLVGYNNVKGMVCNSRDAYKKFAAKCSDKVMDLIITES